MGFFEGAQNFEIHGGNFIDIRGGHIQYNTNMMSIRGNNNAAAMNPTFNQGGPSAPPHDPRYGPTQSNTSTYPGYAQTNSSYTHPSHSNVPPNSTTHCPATERQNVFYHYQASQFMQAQYHPGQQPHPYPPQPGQQQYNHPGQQPYHRPPQSGQQPNHHPSQTGHQPHPQPSQPEQRLYPSPPQNGHDSYHNPPQQQNTTTIHQYQQIFQNSRDRDQRYRSPSPSSTDSEDSEITEVRENFERQDISGRR